MVVDVDDRGVSSDASDRAPGAFEVPRVEKEHELGVDAVRRLGLDIVETWKERVHRWQGRRDKHPDVFALGTKRFGERQAAAERVAVGVLVTEDQDLLIGLDEIPDVVIEVRFVPRRGGYGVASLPSVSGPSLRGSTSFNSSEM